MQEKLQRKVWSPNRSWFRIKHQTLKDSKIQAFGSGDVQFLTAQEVQNCLNIKNLDLWQFQSIDLEGFQNLQFRQIVDGQTLSATNGHIQSAVKTEELKSVFPGKQNKTGAF